MFFVVALPTIPLTVLLVTTFREPKRRESAARADALSASTGDFYRYFRANAGAFLCHNFGFGLLALSGYGALSWIPEFFVRIHGWDRAFVGKAVGLNSMVVGVAGLYFGGFVGDYLARRGRADSKILVGLLAVLVWLPFGLFLPFAAGGRLAFALWIPMTFAAAMPWGAAAAAIQEAVPNQMRGKAAAIFLFVINLVGLGLGPQILPLLTDYVFRDETSDSPLPSHRHRDRRGRGIPPPASRASPISARDRLSRSMDAGAGGSERVEFPRRAYELCTTRALPAAILLASNLVRAQDGADDGEWRFYGADPGATRYAPIDGIDASNVAKLEVAWTFAARNFGPEPELKGETTPLMVDGVLYATAGLTRNVVALDAGTGELLWMYRLDEGDRGAKAPRRFSGRGVAYWSDGADDREDSISSPWATNWSLSTPGPAFPFRVSASTESSI